MGKCIAENRPAETMRNDLDRIKVRYHSPDQKNRLIISFKSVFAWHQLPIGLDRRGDLVRAADQEEHDPEQEN